MIFGGPDDRMPLLYTSKHVPANINNGTITKVSLAYHIYILSHNYLCFQLVDYITYTEVTDNLWIKVYINNTTVQIPFTSSSMYSSMDKHGNRLLYQIIATPGRTVKITIVPSIFYSTTSSFCYHGGIFIYNYVDKSWILSAGVCNQTDIIYPDGLPHSFEITTSETKQEFYLWGTCHTYI